MLLARPSGGKLARKCLLMGAREAKQWHDFSKTGVKERSSVGWGETGEAGAGAGLSPGGSRRERD